MNDPIIDALRSTTHTKLASGDKSRMRNTILKHMNENPAIVRAGAMTRHHWYRARHTRLNHSTTRITITLLIALLLGGSVSYAAEGALPGDTLYAVKTEINENIRHALALSPEAEARLEAQLARERLVEAEALKERGELDDDTRVFLKTEYEAHLSAYERHSEDDDQDDSSHRTTLEVTIDDFDDVLDDKEEDDTTDDSTSGSTSTSKNDDDTAQSDDDAMTGFRTQVSITDDHDDNRTESPHTDTDDSVVELEVELDDSDDTNDTSASTGLQIGL